eukprot:818633-Lingulodinium_polyedra.AAC.1
MQAAIQQTEPRSGSNQRSLSSSHQAAAKHRSSSQFNQPPNAANSNAMPCRKRQLVPRYAAR